MCFENGPLNHRRNTQTVVPVLRKPVDEKVGETEESPAVDPQVPILPVPIPPVPPSEPVPTETDSASAETSKVPSRRNYLTWPTLPSMYHRASLKNCVGYFLGSLLPADTALLNTRSCIGLGCHLWLNDSNAGDVDRSSL